jgi:sarcosine oxidase delta subunit
VYTKQGTSYFQCSVNCTSCINTQIAYSEFQATFGNADYVHPLDAGEVKGLFMTHCLYVWCGNRWDQEFEIIGATQIDKETTLDAWGHIVHMPTKFLYTIRTKVHRIGA